jgi:hypothetical protein
MPTVRDAGGGAAACRRPLRRGCAVEELRDFSLHPQGRPCGRPAAALRPGSGTTVTGAPASPCRRRRPGAVTRMPRGPRWDRGPFRQWSLRLGCRRSPAVDSQTPLTTQEGELPWSTLTRRPAPRPTSACAAS